VCGEPAPREQCTTCTNCPDPPQVRPHRDCGANRDYSDQDQEEPSGVKNRWNITRSQCRQAEQSGNRQDADTGQAGEANARRRDKWHSAIGG
jgi:hypothetical protein